MSKISTVLGANYGDEGKGLITDYLANKYGHESIVIRFNGGAQASHTVVTPDGLRHVFSHFGCGTFVGCWTFLSEFFIVNPATFASEWKELDKIGVDPKVICDPNAIVTTPYDMLVNQQLEKKRGSTRHGSCGMGIYETITRNISIKFEVRHLYNQAVTRQVVKFIREKQRIRCRELDILDDECSKFLNNDAVMENFLDECNQFTKKTCYGDTKCMGDWYRRGRHLIFEGAQGVQLDKDNRADFPYLTPTKTNMSNVTVLLTNAKIKDEVDLYYVTRAYLTRHGEGPMSDEREPYPGVIELTNTYNKWQGHLRFGYLDLGALNVFTNTPYSWNNPINKHLCITCLDQVPENMHIVRNGYEEEITKEHLLIVASYLTYSRKILVSNGNTRDHVSVGYEHN